MSDRDARQVAEDLERGLLLDGWGPALEPLVRELLAEVADETRLDREAWVEAVEATAYAEGQVLVLTREVDRLRDRLARLAGAKAP